MRCWMRVAACAETNEGGVKGWSEQASCSPLKLLRVF